VSLSTLAGELLPLIDIIESAGLAFLDRTAPVRRLAAGKVRVITGADAVAQAAPAWRSLEAEGGAATPFQTLALARHVAEAHVRRGEIPRVVVVRDGAGPVVILPTVITRWLGMPTVRFLGDPLIQYGDAIARPDVRRDHLETAWRAALDPAVAVFAYLRKVRADARIAPLAAQYAATVAADAAPFVDVIRPQAANARDARELRRLRRRLAERGPTELRILRGVAALPALEEALRLACRARAAEPHDRRRGMGIRARGHRRR
jgi:CelD/BcsL family acetyltransferase involved in cellulose biosynthesis